MSKCADGAQEDSHSRQCCGRLRGAWRFHRVLVESRRLLYSPERSRPPHSPLTVPTDAWCGRIAPSPHTASVLPRLRPSCTHQACGTSDQHLISRYRCYGSAAIVVDGQFAAAIEGERFTPVKHDTQVRSTRSDNAWRRGARRAGRRLRRPGWAAAVKDRPRGPFARAWTRRGPQKGYRGERACSRPRGRTKPRPGTSGLMIVIPTQINSWPVLRAGSGITDPSRTSRGACPRAREGSIAGCAHPPSPAAESPLS